MFPFTLQRTLKANFQILVCTVFIDWFAWLAHGGSTGHAGQLAEPITGVEIKNNFYRIIQI